MFSTFHSNVRAFVSSTLCRDRGVDLGVRRGFLASCRFGVAVRCFVVVGALFLVAVGLFVVGMVGMPGGWWSHQKVQVVVCGLTVMFLSLSVVF